MQWEIGHQPNTCAAGDVAETRESVVAMCINLVAIRTNEEIGHRRRVEIGRHAYQSWDFKAGMQSLSVSLYRFTKGSYSLEQ